MAGYNGSGTFVRTYTWATDKTNSVLVTASRMDTEHDGFATGLSTAICKDGQTTTTAIIPFAAGIKLSDGSVGSPALQFTSDTDTGIFRSAANTLNIVVAGTTLLEIGTATVSCGAAMSFTGTLGVSSGGTGQSTTNSVRAYNSADISVNHDTSTALTFDSEDHDTNGLHSTSVATGRLTAAVTGTYVITGNIEFAAGGSVNTSRTVAIKKNGTTLLAESGFVTPSVTYVDIISVTAIAQLSATDYVELIAYQNSGDPLNVKFVAGFSPVFSMVRVSA